MERQANTKSNPQSGSTQKPNLRVVKSAPAVRLGGTLPTESMEPGNYLVSCENAWLEQRGKSHRAALQFRVVDGKHGGVALRMWIDNAADNGGFISPTGKYARACQIALGRPLHDGDPVAEPGEFFSGRRFIVFVGYRKSELPGGRGKFSDQCAMTKKQDGDYLRVHEILSREDL